MGKRTPGTLKYVPESLVGGAHASGFAPSLRGTDGSEIATVHRQQTKGGRDEEAEANAAFLACAWNCHDKLLAACEAAREQLRKVLIGDKNPSGVMDQLDVAIAHARKAKIA